MWLFDSLLFKWGPTCFETKGDITSICVNRIKLQEHSCLRECVCVRPTALRKQRLSHAWWLFCTLDFFVPHMWFAEFADEDSRCVLVWWNVCHSDSSEPEQIHRHGKCNQDQRSSCLFSGSVALWFFVLVFLIVQFYSVSWVFSPPWLYCSSSFFPVFIEFKFMFLFF